METCNHCEQATNLFIDEQGYYWCPEYIAIEYGYVKEEESK